MTEPRPLRAALAGRLPREQAQILARTAAGSGMPLAARGEDTAEAASSVALFERWAAGDRVSGRAFSDQVYSDSERGVLRRLNDATDPGSAALWNALTTDVMYVAWLAYRATGEDMPSDVSEVDETTLDLLDSQWRATSTYDPAGVTA